VSGLTPIHLFAMDVDGTLTDGVLVYAADGTEQKCFHARDGQGIKLLAGQDITPAIISGRASPVTSRRAAELGIEHVHQAEGDKAERLLELCATLGLRAEEAAFIGDDLSDMAAMRIAGWSAAPADAAPEARAAADFVCTSRGGHGAVREAIEALLRREGRWDDILRALEPKTARGA
jgi:3-deoxy-D-manno-octulosonate 8-phosphate phosphatase (KDO 8-P phosphatase)